MDLLNTFTLNMPWLSLALYQVFNKEQESLLLIGKICTDFLNENFCLAEPTTLGWYHGFFSLAINGTREYHPIQPK